MKLVKSLLLSSAVGVTAIASAQAADLPFRKAAPVEYVRVCDYTGAGYFYIPGTDTCLKVGGYLRAEFGVIEPQSYLLPSQNGIANSIVRGRTRDQSGFKAEGRIDVDARTQTAYGTVRTYVRFQMDRVGGNNAGANGSVAGGAATSGVNGTSAYLDKGFIQFAGITAGRAQSMFDFYADNYFFEGHHDSDESVNMFAYTATFGGGFSATVSVEDPTGTRRDGIGNTTTNAFLGTTNVSYGGLRIPDIVGNIRLDQAWGSAQLSGAYHQVNTNNDFGGGVLTHNNQDGFAVQAGVQIKLPMLAAGDQFWLQGAYQQGAYLYQDSDGNMNAGYAASVYPVGGLIHPDTDAVAIYNNATGAYSLQKGEGFSIAGAFQHFFTPTFSDIIGGTYEETSYGKAKFIDWTNGGIGDASSYRLANQFVWTPVNNLSIGLELDYYHIDQTLAHAPGVAATAIPRGIDKDPSAFQGRIRMERDF